MRTGCMPNFGVALYAAVHGELIFIVSTQRDLAVAEQISAPKIKNGIGLPSTNEIFGPIVSAS